ncbi:MAG: M24 family metallopeptidase [Candidatus Puniceispirillum sp.]
MAYLDRQRASKLMSQACIDGLILFSPESFFYATGASPGVAVMWRQTGAVAVFVPADPNIPETAVVSDLFAQNFKNVSHIKDVRESPIWVESTNLDPFNPDQDATEIIKSAWQKEERVRGFSRPATFDPVVCFQHLADAISECGLDKAKIGFEASAVSIKEFPALKSTLVNIDLIDASDVLARLKMVKSDAEIKNLRKAVQIAESGLVAVQDAIAPSITRDELATEWTEAINRHPDHAALTGAWEYISVGRDPWAGNTSAEMGDIIKADVGCLVNGYTSDSARTYVLGAPNELQVRIYQALLGGFIAGSEMLKSSVPLAEVHRVTQDAIRAAGFSDYTRGHFGHGLGAGLGSEEWPFISADATVVFEPGMVIAFECPWYITGLGGFIIENQVLITEDGHEMMNSLPLDLIQIAI